MTLLVDLHSVVSDLIIKYQAEAIYKVYVLSMALNQQEARLI